MRNISPQIFMDEFIGVHSMRLRLLWIGLILSMADDQGRMVDSPAIMRATIFPYDDTVKTEDVAADLQLLAAAHKIHRYQAGTNGDGRALIQIVKWWDHQTKAQWASRSNFPAPEKWVDRIRCHERGSGQKIIEINWKKAGGFMKSLPKGIGSQQGSHLPKGIGSREDEEEDEDRGRGGRKDLPSPLPPPSRSRAGRQAGQSKEQQSTAGNTKKSDADRTTTIGDAGPKLKPKEIKRARQAEAVLCAAGLRDPMLKTISVIVATRTAIQNPQHYVLAALASAFADEGAKRKQSVAAYRIEHDQVEPDFLEPRKWSVLPKKILAAAGIDDLQSFSIVASLQKFGAYNP